MMRCCHWWSLSTCQRTSWRNSWITTSVVLPSGTTEHSCHTHDARLKHTNSLKCKFLLYHTHPFNDPFFYPGEPVPERQNQSGFTEARDSEWQWHQLGHVQVCTQCYLPPGRADIPALKPKLVLRTDFCK